MDFSLERMDNGGNQIYWFDSLGDDVGKIDQIHKGQSQMVVLFFFFFFTDQFWPFGRLGRAFFLGG